jgi:hypothetical protein
MARHAQTPHYAVRELVRLRLLTCIVRGSINSCGQTNNTNNTNNTMTF